MAVAMAKPEVLNKFKTFNDVEPKIWLFPNPKKRCKYVHRMDQGLRSGPHWDELIDKVPNVETNAT